MKKITYILILTLLYFSCEDVIEVNVPNGQERLVIDASLNWFDGTDGSYQTIRLTRTAPFFDNQVPPAIGAIVFVTDQNDTVYNFTDSNDDGLYECFDFNPQLDQTYTLNITYNNEVYVGSETMTSVAPMEFVEQNNEGGFTGDIIELKIFYTDPANQENYYLFEYQEENEISPFFQVYEDKFTDGNQIFAFYSNPDSEIGNGIVIKNYGVSKQFYEFMFILLQQTSDGGGGPFEVQPATVRGNCINQTNPDNYPFGYFRASQATELMYTM
ncbi:DUF4249 domain-containing protein [uncultured Lacinutrix sp.]|uniref:DUF4249 domain-containing protein n=1 Tax=uncultured Lacinutrix sp. TaxID=574032 RepID=UPI00263465CF|nr:DUF4249 domain-containing protein [uncultured Lacinutrix sp.]